MTRPIAVLMLVLLGQAPEVRTPCPTALAIAGCLVQIQERKLPPGHYCQPAARLPRAKEAHPCHCHRVCIDDDNGPARIENDKQCLVYCDEQKHCTCEVHGCP